MIAVEEFIDQSPGLIVPHGGSLINRLVSAREADRLEDTLQNAPRIQISDRSWTDIEMLAIGGFSPLDGFLNEEDYSTVLHDMRLTSGVLWPIPITLAVDKGTAGRLKIGRPAALVHTSGPVGLIHVESIYQPDKKVEAVQIYKTEDEKHPGVAALMAQGEFYVGGQIEITHLPDHAGFTQYNLEPQNTRRAIEKKKWKSVVGFQTRNPLHRAHEYITKVALETSDGLLLHPVMGSTKPGDVPADIRMKTYEALIENYYPADRTLLAMTPFNMFYAGPREAVLHAIIRQNYGCTKFIVGRDHAGIGNYYGPAEAQELISSFSRYELEIEPLCFEAAFWDKRSGGMATERTSNSRPEERIIMSGTDVRRMLAVGQIPPLEVMRPEVAKILINATRKK